MQLFARTSMPDHYALIPAAGSGTRMGAEGPKQYLSLLGRPMIYHAIRRLCASARIQRVYVVLAEQDRLWPRHDWGEFAPKLKPLFCGGETRAESVLNGLSAMRAEVQADDWVLVHDAARPCLPAEHLEKLLSDLGDDPVGGLLAVPVSDTLKQADPTGRVLATQPREGLWQAQTPQMFRHGLLVEALGRARNEPPTDESGAVERLGLRPRLVAGDSRNLKVTYPQDLELASLILENLVKREH